MNYKKEIKIKKYIAKSLVLLFCFSLILNQSSLLIGSAYAQEVSPQLTPITSDTISDDEVETPEAALPEPETPEIKGVSPIFTDNFNQNANLKPVKKAFGIGLSKKNFQAKEQIELIIRNGEGKKLKLSIKAENDPNYAPKFEEKEVNGDTIFTIYPSSVLIPGDYKITVTDEENGQIITEQDFTWGVLAINTNKSIYLPGETAEIAIGLLDEMGNMVCDSASVTLEIINPDFSKEVLSIENERIKVNPECLLHSVTLKPDYQAFYNVNLTGRYNLTLTAVTQNGTFTTKDRFEVRSYVPFDIYRDTATRIYPPEDYPVRLKIKANEAFKGKIIETVPYDFQIKKLENENVVAYHEESNIPNSAESDLRYGIPQLHLPFDQIYPVSQAFGQQIDDPAHRDVYKKSGLDGHDGMDFALPQGANILSVDEGKVILAKEKWIYGTSVVIQHSWGRSYYGHMSKLEVIEGQDVKRGEKIGLSGSTGLSTGPHLHLGIKPTEADVNNLYFGKIDPAPYLGLSSEDPVLSESNYPLGAKTLIWNVDVEKGAEFEIGYAYKAPLKSPNFYNIGPLQFISNELRDEVPAKFDVSPDENILGAATVSAELTSSEFNVESTNTNEENKLVFAEIRQWQIAVDAVTTVILDANSDGTCGSGCWTVPSNWTDINTIHAIGGGGAGDNSSATAGQGGGGGGAYSRITNLDLTPGVNVSFNVATAGTDGVQPTNTWFCSTTTSCANYTDTNVVVSARSGTTATGITGAAGGDTSGRGTVKFAGGAGGTGNITGADSAGGGGGAGSPYGTGGTGGAGDSVSAGAESSGGGGASGCDAIGSENDGLIGGDDGGKGGNSCFQTGGAGGTLSGNGSPGSRGAGGGGGDESGGDGGVGGDGASSVDPALIGGGGGGGDDDTGGIGGNGGLYGGGGGGGATVGTGAVGAIIISFGGGTLTEVMRHGKFFSDGIEQSFTF